MAKALHGSARTTPRLRADLQASQESTRALAARYGLNPKTVDKRRKRTDTSDAPMGPRQRRGAALSVAEEAVVVELRRHTLRPLDDMLGSLRGNLPQLGRSALHRCLVRHGISRLPAGDPAARRKKFAETKIGYVHIDSCELRTAEGKVHLFLAVDRVFKFIFVELHPRATSMVGAAFLRNALAAFPYKLHTILTDSGVAFTDCASTKHDFKVHPFNRVCHAHGIKHKFTKPCHPWTNGQAERMNRPLKEATVKSFHYETRVSLTAHLQTFVLVYNFAKHLKALRWKTPFQTICEAWTKDPSEFMINSHHLIPGPYSPVVPRFERQAAAGYDDLRQRRGGQGHH